MERVICLLLGYLFGAFQTGYIYGKINNIDIRQHGSGNAGATNALRVLGKKAALIVFAGDFLKAVIPCVGVRIFCLADPRYTGMLYLLMAYTGLGAIIGHVFPFYMGFKGGKGIATMAGILVSMDYRLLLICLPVFLAAVLLTRYVSLGSILVAVAFFVTNLYLAEGYYGLQPQYLREFSYVVLVISAIAIWRHKANIKRLFAGTENKLW